MSKLKGQHWIIETTKSSMKATNAYKKKKQHKVEEKKKTLSGKLTKESHKSSKVETQALKVAQEGVEAYKMTKDFHN